MDEEFKHFSTIFSNEDVRENTLLELYLPNQDNHEKNDIIKKIVVIKKSNNENNSDQTRPGSNTLTYHDVSKDVSEIEHGKPPEWITSLGSTYETESLRYNIINKKDDVIGYGKKGGKRRSRRKSRKSRRRSQKRRRSRKN